MNTPDHVVTTSTNRPHCRRPAPCRGARRLLAIVVVILGLVTTPIAMDMLRQQGQRDDPAGTWIKAFGLSSPALWTAGSPARHPEVVHPGVDLRMTIGAEVTP